MSDISELRSAIARGEALVVCGAGATRFATRGTAPNWRDLMLRGLESAARVDADRVWREAAELLLSSGEAKVWLEAANLIQTRLGGPEGAPYQSFLRSTFSKLRADETALIDAIERLSLPVATTNYDGCIGLHLRRNVATWQEPEQVAACLKGETNDIWHIHGHWQRSASVVFSHGDYDRVRQAKLAQFFQSHVVFSRTLVFVGCSASGLNDANVGGILQWFAENFSGLGAKHYAIVVERDLVGPWPTGIVPIACGKAFEELPAFLESLAPAIRRAEYRVPIDPRMVGRQDLREALVQRILAGESPVIIPGGPGIGKTTLAVAAANDPRIAAAFPERVFVSLESASDARSMLARLTQALGESPRGSSEELLKQCASRPAATPAFAILDNVETPLQKDRAASMEILESLSEITSLRLVLTVRGEIPVLSRGVVLGDVEKLEIGDARTLFVREAANAGLVSDVALEPLLRALDGHPLSIKLLAAQAQGLQDLSLVQKAWEARKAELLLRGDAGRLTSTRASLAISLNNCDADAKRVFGILSLLPGGISQSELDKLLPRVGVSGALALVNKRLASQAKDRIRVLAPLREAGILDCQLSDGDRKLLFDQMLALVASADALGTAKWIGIAEHVLSEAGNFDTIAQLAVQEYGLTDAVMSALKGIRELSVFQGEGGTRAIDIALELARRNSNAAAEAALLQSLAALAAARSDRVTALDFYKQALLLFEKIADPIGMAHSILRIAEHNAVDGDTAAARNGLDKAQQFYEGAGYELGVANCISIRGFLSMNDEDVECARRELNLARAIYGKLDNVLGEANCLDSLGDIDAHAGAVESARANYVESARLFRLAGNPLGEATCLVSLGDLLRRSEDHAGARELYETALARFERLGRWWSIGHVNVALSKVAQGDVEEQMFLEAARLAWARIARQDLIEKHIAPG